MAFHLVVGIAKQEGIISAENSNSCKKKKTQLKINDSENEGVKIVKRKAK